MSGEVFSREEAVAYIKSHDRSQRIPEKAEVFPPEEAMTYYQGCDYKETSDYAIPAAFMDREIGIRGRRVLEECPGPANLAYELWMLGAEVTGLDASPTMIEYASKKYKLNRGMEFREGSVYQMPFRDNTFDVACCQNSWHQLYEPFKALKEMARVIRPGGYGFIFDFKRDADDEALIERLLYTKPKIVPLFFDSVLAALTRKEFEDSLSQIKSEVPEIEFSVVDAPNPHGLSARVDELIEIDTVPHWRDYKISQIVKIHKNSEGIKIAELPRRLFEYE